MKIKTVLLILSFSVLLMSCKEKEQLPVTDLHIHLKGDFGVDDAVKKSRTENISYGIAFNCGLKFPIHQDSQIDSVLLTMKDYPQFLPGMQAEGREWVNMFSGAGYAREMIKKCNLTTEDFFKPANKRQDG